MLQSDNEVCLNCDMKTASEIIDELGGTVAVAKICDIEPSAVSQWRTSKKGIPKPWLKYFETKYRKVFAERKSA